MKYSKQTIISVIGLTIAMLGTTLSHAQSVSEGSKGGGGTPDYPDFIKITVNRTLMNNPEVDAAKSIVLALIGRSISIGQVTGYRAKVENGKVVICLDLAKNRDAYIILLRSIDQAANDPLNADVKLLLTETLEKSCI